MKRAYLFSVHSTLLRSPSSQMCILPGSGDREQEFLRNQLAPCKPVLACLCKIATTDTTLSQHFSYSRIYHKAGGKSYHLFLQRTIFCQCPVLILYPDVA